MHKDLTQDRRILCLWLPNWPIQRLVVAQLELKRQFVVLFRQDSRKGRLVAAASPLAHQAGVQLSMPLSEAKTLLGQHTKRLGTHFHILQHDPTSDLFALEALADQLDEFSPMVGLQQDSDFPDCLFLDITGLGKLFGSETKLHQSVQDFCQNLGYLVRIAIAPTIGHAQALTQFPLEKQADVPTQPVE
ncbi:MAG: hypothetical protein AAGA30_12355, partial [Planctomycetota bacterium]